MPVKVVLRVFFNKSNIMANTKTCSKCGRELPISEFYKDKSRKDGYRSECKECSKLSKKKYNSEHREEINEKNRLYKSKNKEKILEIQRQFRREHPELRKEFYQKNRDKELEQAKKYRSTKIGEANRIANAYRRSDIRYGRENNIDGQWIVDNIYTDVCFYCGENDWHKLGCDRIDNSIGHIIGNVVPCCKKCNIKRGKMSFEEFCELMQNSF